MNEWASRQIRVDKCRRKEGGTDRGEERIFKLFYLKLERKTGESAAWRERDSTVFFGASELVGFGTSGLRTFWWAGRI